MLLVWHWLAGHVPWRNESKRRAQWTRASVASFVIKTCVNLGGAHASSNQEDGKSKFGIRLLKGKECATAPHQNLHFSL